MCWHSYGLLAENFEERSDLRKDKTTDELTTEADTSNFSTAKFETCEAIILKHVSLVHNSTVNLRMMCQQTVVLQDCSYTQFGQESAWGLAHQFQFEVGGWTVLLRQDDSFVPNAMETQVPYTQAE